MAPKKSPAVQGGGGGGQVGVFKNETRPADHPPRPWRPMEARRKRHTDAMLPRSHAQADQKAAGKPGPARAGRRVSAAPLVLPLLAVSLCIYGKKPQVEHFSQEPLTFMLGTRGKTRLTNPK
jgi:hypothetical protein